MPNEGSALFVYYHGTLPIDVYYVIAKCMLHKKRTLHCVGDKFIFKMPGILFVSHFLPPGQKERRKECPYNFPFLSLLFTLLQQKS